MGSGLRQGGWDQAGGRRIQTTELDDKARHWLRTGPPLLFAVVGLLVVLGWAGQALDLVTDTRRFAAFLFFREDIGFAVALAMICRFGMGQAVAARHEWMALIARHPWLIALALTAFCWAGHYIVFGGRDFSRDEQMASFDAFIYAHGRLSWPVAPAWRPMLDALNSSFIFPVIDNRAWVSAYLPGNAALRALVGLVADPALTSPLLAGIGALALWRIARRLWPDDPAPTAIALLLYAGSSQILFTGMTGFAMTAHLAFNLLWLMLFLRGGVSGHAGAAAIGFVATGLHQPIFHPLFVAPFLLLLAWQRRWRAFAFYTGAYAAIGLFWLLWPHLLTSAIGAGPAAAGTSMGERIVELLELWDVGNIWLTILNLLRFLSWQHLFFLPLFATGLALCWRQPLVMALAGGILLHMAAVLLLLAYQGHGWGYRYLHGVIGNACLIGGYGWARVGGRLIERRLWIAANVATFLIAMPVHGWRTAQLVAPFGAMSARIGKIDADIVVIEDRDTAFAGDLAGNRPDLTNRPLHMIASALSPQQVAALCRDHRVAFAGHAMLEPIQRVIPQVEGDHRAFAALQQACRSARPEPKP